MLMTDWTSVTIRIIKQKLSLGRKGPRKSERKRCSIKYDKSIVVSKYHKGIP